MKTLFPLLFLRALTIPIVVQSTQDSTVNPQEQNKALVRRFCAEVWEKDNLAAAEVFAANYVRHDPRGGPPADAFQEKSTQGIKTSKREIDLVKDRLKRLKEMLR